MARQTARIADLEAAVAFIERAAKKMIDGSSGAEAMNHLLLAKASIVKKLHGLRIKRPS